MALTRHSEVREGHGLVATDRTLDGGGDRLVQLCARLLAITRPDAENHDPNVRAPGLAAKLREELADIVEGAARELAEKLRGELALWTLASEQFEKVARCRYLAVPDHFRELARQFDLARQHAERVTEALAALGERDPFAAAAPMSQARDEPAECSRPLALPVIEAGAAQTARALVDVTNPQRQQRNHFSLARSASEGARPVGLEDSTRPTKPAELASNRSAAQAKRREEPKHLEQSDQVRARSTHALAAPKRTKLAPVGVTLSIDCPSCGAGGAVRCDRLGRLHVCRRCTSSFRVDATGGLVEVVKSGDGKWIDKRAFERTSKKARAVRLLTRRLLPAMVLVGVVVLGYRLTSQPAAAQPPDLPRDLQSRVELFTKAWLRKDWSLLRRFAAPGEDRPLYNWFVRNPPTKTLAGQIDEELSLQVIILSTQGQPATVKVRIGSAAGKPTLAPVEVLQFWREHEAGWFVAPEVTTGGQRASAVTAGRSSSR
jgi:hypothetical protein